MEAGRRTIANTAEHREQIHVAREHRGYDLDIILAMRNNTQ
jgi:hypothetical protein